MKNGSIMGSYLTGYDAGKAWGEAGKELVDYNFNGVDDYYRDGFFRGWREA